MGHATTSFVISDSTYPGAGASHVAHVFPRQTGSYADLSIQAANLMMFGAYGIPASGPNLCGYAPQTADEELCVRYFQLAITSPLAVLNSMIAPMPYTFQSKTRTGIVTALRQRLSLFSYMRASLQDISYYGGVMHTPLFAIYDQWGFTEDILAASDVSGFMYGPALRVELQYKQFTYEKEVRFPAGSRWVRLNTWDTYVAGQDYLSIMAKTGIDKEVNIYQMDSTIVPLQDASTVIRVEDLMNVSYTLSVALGKKNTA